jgi:hypothetical protein
MLTVGLLVVGGGWIGGGGVQEVRGDQQACMQKVWCSQGVSDVPISSGDGG